MQNYTLTGKITKLFPITDLGYMDIEVAIPKTSFSLLCRVSPQNSHYVNGALIGDVVCLAGIPMYSHAGQLTIIDFIKVASVALIFPSAQSIDILQ
jgi:hypothetical protein